MVQTTRRLLGSSAPTQSPHSLQGLGDDIPDSLLRKLCASCHLGQPKNHHNLDVVRDRGGGCLACHINAYRAGAHPELTVRVEDGRCFGCHSRSGRISLSYPGLAEAGADGEPSGERLRLPDGRLLERKPSDVHHRAGMACIDCHTGPGLMGLASPRHETDIACRDCHANRQGRITPATWPERFRSMLPRVPFAAGPDQPFLTTEDGTPLWHIQLRPDGAFLHSKLGHHTLRIPPMSPERHPAGPPHQRLGCQACHAQWAPQCYGCHLGYESGEPQWDHSERAVTPGRWHERRWAIRNGPPPLGLTSGGEISPVVPGMILTLEHPDLAEPLFLRRFAALAPHTTGPGRGCRECHRSPVAVGLGTGELTVGGGDIAHVPSQGPLRDGLAADAWTTLEAPLIATPREGDPRPFSPEEIRRILSTPLPTPDG
jgi:hypothetical protein